MIAGLGYGLTSPVFRAYSPDGLTEIRLLPAFRWEVMRDSKSGWEGLDVPPEHIYLNGVHHRDRSSHLYRRAQSPLSADRCDSFSCCRAQLSG